MSTTELKACPFCGSHDVSLSIGKQAGGADWHYIECSNCEACAEPDWWNRRAASEAPAEPVAPIKDHVIAQTVNELRDIAVQFHATQQLRERIAHVVVPLLKKAPDGWAFPVYVGKLGCAAELPAQPVSADTAKIAAVLQNGKTATNVYEAYREGMKEAAADSRCQSCHGVFDEAALKPTYVAAVVKGEHRKQLLICESCFKRFHTEALEAKKAHSTQ